VATSLEKLEVPKQRIDHIVSQDNPELLAKLIKELLG
jgi:hypothetical protein